MLFSSHLPKYNLNSIGYFLLGCDVLRSGGNLLMCCRDVCNFTSYLKHSFLQVLTIVSHNTIKAFIIRPFSKYMYIVRIRTYYCIPSLFGVVREATVLQADKLKSCVRRTEC
jgi:hypothetical protein